MASMSLTALLPVLLSLTPTLLAQSPPISTSGTFVLYPYITAGNLSGPYTNAGITKSQPLRPTSGQESGTWTSDCFNRHLLTNYVPTHCAAGTDQCGYQRWSLNDTSPEEATGPATQTLAGYISGLSSLLIAPASEADDLGRRDVGWTSLACGNEPKMTGFSVQSGVEGILRLEYDDADGEEFGTFMACWMEGDIYGPRVFYRGEGVQGVEGCADLWLVPRCVNETSLAPSSVGVRCYQGGLPA